jgi:Protein of unknown function (DUF3433)
MAYQPKPNVRYSYAPVSEGYSYVEGGGHYAQTASYHGRDERYDFQQGAPYYSYGTQGGIHELPSQQYDNTSSMYSDYTAPTSKNPRPQRPAHFYIPPILRLPSLLLIFLITLALIGAVEYGVQKLPHAQKTAHEDPKAFVQSLLHAKRETTAISTAPTTSTIPITPTPTPQATGTTIPIAYVPGDISTTSTTSSVVNPAVVPTTSPDNYVPPSIVTSTALATATGAYVPPTINTDPTVVNTALSYLPGSLSGSTVLTSPMTMMPSAGSSGAYIPPNLPASTSSGAYVPPNLPPSSSLSYSAQFLTTSTTIPTTFVTSIPSSIVTTDSEGRLTTSVTWMLSSSTGSVTLPTTIAVAETISGPLFPKWTVFVANYLPLIVVVLFRQFWSAIYSQTKLIEPFSLLNQGRGVSAAAVLHSFYLSSNLMPDPVLALMLRHWSVLWTSLVYFAISFLGPLCSEFIFLDTNYPNCPYRNNQIANNPCWPPRLTIDPSIARVIEGLLAYVAVMTLTIVVMMMRTHTGIYSDPSSIASITSLVHHPEVVQDFRAFSEEASAKDVREFLRDKAYRLGEYQRADGVWRYGIIPTLPSFDYTRESKPAHRRKPKARRWKVLDYILDFIFILCLLAVAGIVVAYYIDGRNDAFNRFFNSGSFGPRFVLTGTGTIIALNWKRLERGQFTFLAYLILLL